MRIKPLVASSMLLAFAIGLCLALFVKGGECDGHRDNRWRPAVVVLEPPSVGGSGQPLRPIDTHPFPAEIELRILDAITRCALAGFEIESDGHRWITDDEGGCAISPGLVVTGRKTGYATVGPVLVTESQDILVHPIASVRDIALSVNKLDGSPAVGIRVGAWMDRAALWPASLGSRSVDSVSEPVATAMVGQDGAARLSVPVDSDVWIDVIDVEYCPASYKPVLVRSLEDSCVLTIADFMLGVVRLNNACPHGYKPRDIGWGYVTPKDIHTGLGGFYINRRIRDLRARVQRRINRHFPSDAVKVPPFTFIGVEMEGMALDKGSCLRLSANIASVGFVDLLISRAIDWRMEFLTSIEAGTARCAGHAIVRVDSDRDLLLVKAGTIHRRSHYPPDYEDDHGRTVFENVPPGSYVLVERVAMSIRTKTPLRGVTVELRDGDDILVTDQMLNASLPASVYVKFEVIRKDNCDAEWGLGISRKGDGMVFYSSECFDDTFTETFVPELYRYGFFRVSGSNREQMVPLFADRELDLRADSDAKERVIPLILTP